MQLLVLFRPTKTIIRGLKGESRKLTFESYLNPYFRIEALEQIPGILEYP